MTAVARLAVRGLLRDAARTVVRLIVLAAAVALLATMIVFVGHALATMTGSAVRGVPLDWQGPVGSYQAALRTAKGVARQPDVLAAVPTATAQVTNPTGALRHRAAVGNLSAVTVAMLAVPPGYVAHFKTLRFLRGSLGPGQIVLDQQLAATLQVQPGDTVALEPTTHAGAIRFLVSGIALVTAPDVLFQPLNPLLGPAPAQPPVNVVVVPLDTFARRIAPAVPAGSSGVPGAPAGVQWQVQAQVDPASLTGSPSQALARAGQIRNSVERSLPGQVQFVDNLSDGLTSAAGDALYAEALFIMLAVPGALIALGLAYLAALGTADRDRRDLALLLARGASRRELLLLAAVESLVLGVVAGGLGTGVGILAARHVVSNGLELGTGRALATLGICILVATLGALAARVGASLAVLRSPVTEGRRSVRRAGKPLWQRLYLDLAALALSGLVYWLTAQNGFSAIVNPDSNPTLSLSVYMFFAPALLWFGAALLLVRLRGRLLEWIAARAGGTRSTSWRRFLLASASRRGAAINRGLILVALLLAFGVALGVFTATYDQQARIDAQLTLGADVVVTAPPGVAAKRGLPVQISRLPGVAGVSAVDHSYSYIGPDLQDTFGIDAQTLSRGTTLRDSFFLAPQGACKFGGGSAGTVLSRLQSTPDGIVVSKETICDYSLRLGDRLLLRLLDRAAGKFRIVPFHVVGVVQEFPAAPRDSFMVANLAYLQRVSHDGGPNVILVKSAGDPVALAHRVAAATRTAGTTVKDITHQSVQTVSSITAVDLSGISRIEQAFALALAALAMALIVAVGLAERRQELATMAALGTSLRRVASFLWSEAVLVLAASLALSALLGWLMAEMLVSMLQHVFDPPPDHLAAPWGFLAALAGAALLGTALAALLAVRGVRRFRLGAILREE